MFQIVSIGSFGPAESVFEGGLVGFSDGIFSEISDPKLSSVDQHGYEMGTMATQMLLKRIDADESFFPYETRILKANLIVRESSVDTP